MNYHSACDGMVYDCRFVLLCCCCSAGVSCILTHSCIMLCVVCQGALVGCIVSSVFSLFLAIGTFIVRPHRETLPTSVERCNLSYSLSAGETAVGEQLLWTTAVSNTRLSWNETVTAGRRLLAVGHSSISSVLDYAGDPTGTTSELSSASYVHQLWVKGHSTGVISQYVVFLSKRSCIDVFKWYLKKLFAFSTAR